MQKPTVGRIVHYTARGSADGVFGSVCRAAVIAEVLSDTEVSIVVLNPAGIFFDDAPYDPSNTPGSWHWPERED